MRSPERIDKYKEELFELLKKHSDLNLGYIICESMKGKLFYYIEDNMSIGFIRSYLKDKKEKYPEFDREMEIEGLVNCIVKIWKHCPDFRFTQLITNAVREYYLQGTSDKQLHDILLEYYKG